MTVSALANHRLEAAVAEALRTSGRRIVVTGAGGWIGMASLDLLARALGDGFRERVQCFGSSARTLTLLDGTRIAQRPLAELGTLAPAPTLLLHFAFLTKDRAEAMDEAAFRAANAAIDAAVLDALDAIGADGVFVASSGAARFAEVPEAAPAMRLYGAMKLAQEDAFATWATAGGRRLAIGRLFNLAGPYINKRSSYALSSFLLAARAGGPIRIAAGHEVWRGYVAIRELLSLALAILLDGRDGAVRFDTGGTAMELGDVAAAIAARMEGVAVERAAPDGAPADRYLGDAAGYAALLEAYAIAPVEFSAQIDETADFLRFSIDREAREKLDIGKAAW